MDYFFPGGASSSSAPAEGQEYGHHGDIDDETLNEEYALQLQEYMRLISQIEEQYGNTSDEMVIVVRRLVDMLRLYEKHDKMLTFLNHLQELEVAVFTVKKAKLQEHI